jgi:hypothetical protein
MTKRKYRFGNEWRWTPVNCEDCWQSRRRTEKKYGLSFDCEQYGGEDGWECYHESCSSHAVSARRRRSSWKAYVRRNEIASLTLSQEDIAIVNRVRKDYTSKYNRGYLLKGVSNAKTKR